MVRTITTQASFGKRMPVVLYKFDEFIDIMSVERTVLACINEITNLKTIL